MNQRRFIVALSIVALASGTALAQEATPDTWLKESRSTLTREEVRAQVIASGTVGERQLRDEIYAFEPIANPRSRAEVQAELMQARASGELARLNADAYAFPSQPTLPTLVAGSDNR